MKEKKVSFLENKEWKERILPDGVPIEKKGPEFFRAFLLSVCVCHARWASIVLASSTNAG